MSLAVLSYVAGLALAAITWGDLLCSVGHALNRPRLQAVAHNVFMELKPFFWPLLFATLLEDLVTRSMGWADYLFAAIMIVWGLLVKNRHRDEDDRWKRRREKAVETVTRRGSRLVVVPAGSQS